MAKRKPEEVKPGAPAWQSTFADLMNLLLCFFVMLFAMSSVDEQKFEMIAASFSQTFSIFEGGGSALLEGLLISNGVSQLSQLDVYMNTMGQTADSSEESEEYEEFDEKVKAVQDEMLKENEELAEKIEEIIAEQNLEGDIDVDFNSQYVELVLNGALLFDSGKAELKEAAYPLMEKVGVILQKYAKDTVEVEGHTDNVPISTAKFANNNELSSARALSVFDYLVENTSLDPANIKLSGRGEYVPVADNSTPEGRAQNRRVEIKIYSALDSLAKDEVESLSTDAEYAQADTEGDASVDMYIDGQGAGDAETYVDGQRPGDAEMYADGQNAAEGNDFADEQSKTEGNVYFDGQGGEAADAYINIEANGEAGGEM